jgi:hypothetical protein
MGSSRMHSQQIVRSSGRPSLARRVGATRQRDEGLYRALTPAKLPVWLAGPSRLPGSGATVTPTNQQDHVGTLPALRWHAWCAALAGYPCYHRCAGRRHASMRTWQVRVAWRMQGGIVSASNDYIMRNYVFKVRTLTLALLAYLPMLTNHPTGSRSGRRCILLRELSSLLTDDQHLAEITIPVACRT